MESNVITTRLKARREALGLSQIELARVVGVERGSIWSWESGGKIPRQPTLLRLASALQTTTDYLLGATDDPTPRLHHVQAPLPHPDRPPWADELLSEIRALRGEVRQALHVQLQPPTPAPSTETRPLPRS